MTGIAAVATLAAIAVPSLKSMHLRAQNTEYQIVLEGVAQSIDGYCTAAVPGQIFAEDAGPADVGGDPIRWDVSATPGWNALGYAADGRVRATYGLDAWIDDTGRCSLFTVTVQQDLDHHGAAWNVAVGYVPLEQRGACVARWDSAEPVCDLDTSNRYAIGLEGCAFAASPDEHYQDQCGFGLGGACEDSFPRSPEICF